MATLSSMVSGTSPGGPPQATGPNFGLQSAGTTQSHHSPCHRLQWERSRAPLSEVILNDTRPSRNRQSTAMSDVGVCNDARTLLNIWTPLSVKNCNCISPNCPSNDNRLVSFSTSSCILHPGPHRTSTVAAGCGAGAFLFTKNAPHRGGVVLDVHQVR
jgi:hypothetical protein